MKKIRMIQFVTILTLMLFSVVSSANAQVSTPSEISQEQRREARIIQTIKDNHLEGKNQISNFDAVLTNQGARIVNYPATIDSIFPDPVLATAVALMLNKEVGDPVVKADLDAIKNISLFGGDLLDLTGLEELSELFSFTVMNNDISDVSYVDWSKIPNLEFLSFSNTKISDITTFDFSKLTSLTNLNLANNEIENINTDWSYLNRLRFLMLMNNKIKDVKSVNWAGLNDLMLIDLSNNQISDLSFKWTGMPALNSITLFSNQIASIKDADFSELTQMINVSIDMQQIVLDKEVRRDQLIIDNVAQNIAGNQIVVNASTNGVYDAVTGKIEWNNLSTTQQQVQYAWQEHIATTNGVQVSFNGTVTIPLATGFELTFKDYDGSILYQNELVEGANIVAPVVPERFGYVFTGWTPSLQVLMPAQATEYVATYAKEEIAAIQPTQDLGRTCQADGYPTGYYWNGTNCVIEPLYKVPNTGIKAAKKTSVQAQFDL